MLSVATGSSYRWIKVMFTRWVLVSEDEMKTNQEASHRLKLSNLYI